MNIGKIPESVLKRSVFKQIKINNSGAILGPRVGEDAAAIYIGQDETVMLSANPVIGTVEEIGKLGVILAVNNLVAQGAIPVGIMVDLLLPPSSTEPELRRIMKELEEECKNRDMIILGGNTEVSEAVNLPILCITGVGRERQENIIKTSGMKPGDDIVATKYTGLYGTAKIARKKEEELLTRYARPFIEVAQNAIFDLSVEKEAKIAKQFGVSAMHDVSKGGIFGAIWEMASASNVGVEILLSKIPIRQHTIEVCEFFDLNPYQLISNGSLLISTQKGNELVELLEKEKIPAAIIGKAVKGNDRVVYYEEEKRFLEPSRGDEIYKIK